MSLVRVRHVLAWMILAGIAFAFSACAIDGFCESGAVGCAADSCGDRERDGDETDVDCGGSCRPCPSASRCINGTDCASQRCYQAACCEPPCVIDARGFGGPGFDRITSTAYLPDGSLVIAGEMSDTVDFGGGPLTSAGGPDVFVVAFAPDGGFLWQRRFGGKKVEGTPLLAVTPNGEVYVAGIFQSPLDTGTEVLLNSGGYADLFIIELDGSGNTVQSKALSSQATSVGISDLAATADGGLVMIGELGRLDFGDGTVLISDNGPFPGGPSDVYVARFDANLQRVWHRQLGDEQNDFNFGLELDAAGNVVVGLASTTATTFGGPPVDQPGNVIASFSGVDGAYQWGRSYGVGFSATALSIDGDGNVLMLGNLSSEADLGLGKLLPKGTRDAFVARLTATGEVTWLTPLPSDIESYGLSVRRDPQGGIVASIGVTGDFSAGGITASTGADSLVFVRMDENGTVEWARNLGGIVLNTGVGLASTPSGYLLAFGGYAGTLDMGNLGPANGAADAFVATLLP